MSTVYVEQFDGDNGIVIANASIGRKIDLPPTWKKLNMSLLFNFTTGSNSSISGTPRWTMGLCSGSQFIGDPTVGHFYGLRTNTATWTYGSASGVSYYYHNTRNEYTVHDNTASLGSDIENAFFYGYTNEDLSKKTILQMTIDRSASPSYSIRQFRCNSPSTPIGATYNDFLESLQTDTMVLEDCTYTNTVFENVYEDESGSFDHINIAWDREEPAAPNLLIYAIGVNLFA